MVLEAVDKVGHLVAMDSARLGAGLEDFVVGMSLGHLVALSGVVAAGVEAVAAGEAFDSTLHHPVTLNGVVAAVEAAVADVRPRGRHGADCGAELAAGRDAGLAAEEPVPD